MATLRLLGLSGLLLVGCQSDAAFETTGGRIDVRVLADGYVGVAGKRMPRGEFILALRQQVRALGDDRESAPLVAVAAEASVSSKEIDLLLRDLRNAGIWRVNLGH